MRAILLRIEVCLENGLTGKHDMFKQYDREDDHKMISFWIIAGGILASLVLKSMFFLLFSIVMCYYCLRTDSNIRVNKPFWTPGRFSRHFYDSYDRLSRNRYNGGGYYSKSRKKNNRY
jgi:hypothetical protein